MRQSKASRAELSSCDPVNTSQMKASMQSKDSSGLINHDRSKSQIKGKAIKRKKLSMALKSSKVGEDASTLYDKDYWLSHNRNSSYTLRNKSKESEQENSNENRE